MTLHFYKVYNLKCSDRVMTVDGGGRDAEKEIETETDRDIQRFNIPAPFSDLDLFYKQIIRG